MNIAVYCGSTTGNNSHFAESAKALGKWIGESGNTLVYGGANRGLMGIVADAVLENGGKVIGVLPDVPRIQERKHTGLTEIIKSCEKTPSDEVGCGMNRTSLSFCISLS